MDILSTLKSEYARTLILLVIPGAIALEPYAIMLYSYFDLHVTDFKDYFLYVAISYLFASIFVGFIIQDLGARLEVFYDWLYCKIHQKNYKLYNRQFSRYLFNKKEEEYVVTHYYRSMLVRMKFELHSVVAILILWSGMIIRACITDLTIDWTRTNIFIIISGLIFIYLNFEAYKGVRTLYFFRSLINKKFRPNYRSEVTNG